MAPLLIIISHSIPLKTPVYPIKKTMFQSTNQNQTTHLEMVPSPSRSPSPHRRWIIAPVERQVFKREEKTGISTGP